MSPWVSKPAWPERADLYATATGALLHLSPSCCGGGGERRRVRDHSNPSYFNDPHFFLCIPARRAAAPSKPKGTK